MYTGQRPRHIRDNRKDSRRAGATTLARQRPWVAALGVALLIATVTSGLAASPTSATAARVAQTMTATAKDLGTLGGNVSSAVAVDGNLVVGDADTSDNWPH